MPSQNYDRGKQIKGNMTVYDFNNVGQVVQSLVGSSLMISMNRAYEFSCHGNQGWI